MKVYRKKRELAEWIRRKINLPGVKIPLDTSQIDDAIDQACDMFAEFAGGIGNEDSIVLINPELVYYDGTGKESQPGPTSGKWRKPVPKYLEGLTLDQINALTPEEDARLKAACIAGTLPTTSSPASSCCPSSYNSSTDVYGGVDGNPDTTYQINQCECPEESKGPGPGWCGDNIQPAHCFTETDPGDPTAYGPYWIEGDTTVKPSRNGYIYKSVYDVPTDIIATGSRLDTGMFGMYGMTEDNALFAPMGMLMQGGGSWGMLNSRTGMDNRWGFWMGSGGGYVDIVSWQIGMSYLEMFRQLFTVKMNVQFKELEHKVVLTPPPNQKGIIAIACTRRVPDEAIYSHVWVKEYALALTMINIGMNSGRYANMNFPGGGSVNYDMYFTRGDALREKLEKQLWDDRQYSVPCDFFIG